jgi:VWFA-related protein
VRILAIGIWVAFVCLAQEPPAFKTAVSLVHVDAEVTDGTRTLGGFHREDFIVKDNGQPQTIVHFSQEEEPLDVILLFDISGSMRPKIQKVAESAHTALAELRPGDRVAVMTFHGSSRLVLPLTDDRDTVERTINKDILRGKFRGGTRLLAGVDDAAKYFLEQPRSERRRAVLILTDNFGQRSRRGGTVVHRLWEADALLSGLIIRSGSDAFTMAIRIADPVAAMMSEGMEGVAEKTGGDALKADDPGAAFREMMRRIRQRYSLYYAMPQGKPGEQRQVRVELSGEALGHNTGARVRARKGYLMPRQPG